MQISISGQLPKQKPRSRSPIQKSPLKQQISSNEEANQEQQIAQAYNMINQGIQQYQNKLYPYAKIILVNASQILLPIIKQNQLDPTQKNIATQQLTKALQFAEDCNKQIGTLMKYLSQQDQYNKQIVETAMIRKCEVGFNQIVGLEKVKKQLEEVIILPNLRPDIFKGIRAPPKGILFYGPPGNGKTLLAKAVANQIKCCFFNVSASTLVQKHLGEGEKLMKALFLIATKFQPSVIFIDEIDSILSSRSSEEHEASRRLKTEFLISFDGMQTSDQDRVFLIAATNRPQDIDAAVLRRFTVKILIDQPDEKARMALLKSLLNEIKCTLLDSHYQKIVQMLQGYSASDIKAVVKEACMQPLRQDIAINMIMSINQQEIKPVRFEDFQKAIEIVKPSLTQKQYKEYISFQDR